MKTIDLLITPPIVETNCYINHTNEMIILDKQPYEGKLPIVDYELNQKDLNSFKTKVPPPKTNTYVLNIKEIDVKNGNVFLSTNYTNMRSQFALRRWIPELNKDDKIRKIILNRIMPVGGEMVLETIDDYILIEERGKSVEVSGLYMPAPAGGCETKDWRVFPKPFRSIKGEAWEETGQLPGEDYGNVTLIGVVRDQTHGYNPTFIYHAKSNLTLNETMMVAENIAPGAKEHASLLGIKSDEQSLLQFCLDYAPQLIGNGLGSLLSFGNNKFSNTDVWLSTAIKELKNKNWDIRLHQRFPI